MADETETTSTETGAPSNAELAGRVDALDSKLDSILDVLKGTEGKAHAAAQQHTEDRLDAPTSVADEIRRQLEERDRKAASDAAAADQEAWKAGVTKTLGDLTEQKPEPPQRAVEKLMWGRR